MTTDKPPQLGKNFEWVKHGAGYDLRFVRLINGKRHRRVIGHLGCQAWLNLQSRNPLEHLVNALREKFSQRIEERTKVL